MYGLPYSLISGTLPQPDRGRHYGCLAKTFLVSFRRKSQLKAAFCCCGSSSARPSVALPGSCGTRPKTAPPAFPLRGKSTVPSIPGLPSVAGIFGASLAAQTFRLCCRFLFAGGFPDSKTASSLSSWVGFQPTTLRMAEPGS